jgi:hypothetical protein
MDAGRRRPACGPVLRRNEPILGLTAIGLLTVDGLLGVTYGFLDTG